MFIITKTFTDDEGHLFTKVNPKQYSTPGEAYDAMREDYLNELNGKEMQVQYPVSNLITFEMIKNKVISAWAIAPRKLSDEVKEFLAENCAGYSKYWSDIPMKTVSRIESGRKVLWKNPCFEGDRK